MNNSDGVLVRMQSEHFSHIPSGLVASLVVARADGEHSVSVESLVVARADGEHSERPAASHSRLDLRSHALCSRWCVQENRVRV